jgi:putative endonuclease
MLSEVYPKTYVGITNDIRRRLREHNAGEQIYTKRYVPWKMIYKEDCITRNLARKKEVYLKSAAGRNWLKKNILNKMPGWRNW